MHTVGKIDIDKYKCVTDGIKSSEVIITDERIQHIKDRHPNDYEKYCGYMRDIVSNLTTLLKPINQIQHCY